MGEFEHMLSNEHTKEALKEAFRDVFEDIRPLAIAFIREGYCLAIPKESIKNKEDLIKKMEGKKISERSDKIEVIFINLETVNTTASVVFKIDRTDADEPKLVPYNEMSIEWTPKEKKLEGVLQNILNVDYHPIADLNSIN